MSAGLPGLHPGLRAAITATPDTVVKLTPQDIRDITEAAEWALDILQRLISAAAESPNFLAELDDLLFEIKNGLRAESPDADREPQHVLDGVSAGGFLQGGEAVAKLAAYDRFFGQVHSPDLTESREVGDVVAAEVGHDSSPSFDARPGAGHTASVGEAGPGSGELPGPSTPGGAQ